MIQLLEPSEDKAKFPIVRWYESRGAHSPAAFGKAYVECRIMKNPEDGELFFVARGSKRYGAYEEGKPWSKLTGFRSVSAESLYVASFERAVRSHLPGKMTSLVLHDGAQVVLVDFEDDHPIHLNCAEASSVEIDHLCVVLSNHFGNPKLGAGRNVKKKLFYWPLDDDNVETYNPATKPDKTISIVTEVVSWAVVALILGAFAAAFWYVLL